MRYDKLLFVIISLVFISLFVYPEKLKIWIMPNGANSKETLEKQLKEFTADNKIEVEVELIDWGIAFNKISEALKDGNGPDVLQLGTTWVPYFADLGYLTDLTKYEKEIDFKRFNLPNLQTCQIFGTSNYYAVPWFIDIRTYFFNKKYMDELNINPESLKDYYGFKEYLHKVKKANLKNGIKSVDPLGFTGKSEWNILHNISPWIWSEGGDFITFKDGIWESGLLDKKTINGMYKFINLSEEGYNSPDALKESSAVIQRQFVHGDYAGIMTVLDIIKTINDEYEIGGKMRSPLYEKEYYILEPPSGAEGSFTFLGGSNLAIPITKKGNKNAFKLLKYLTMSNNIDSYCNDIKFLPPDMTLWSKWQRNETYSKAVLLLKNGKTYPNIPMWGEIGAILVNCFGEVMELTGSTLFNYEKLYDILIKYNYEINKYLHLKKDVKMSRIEFTNYISSYKNSINTTVEINNTLNFIIYMTICFFVLIIVIIIILLINKLRFSGLIKNISQSILSSFILFAVLLQLVVSIFLGYVITLKFTNTQIVSTIERNSNISKSILMFINSKLESYIEKLYILSNTEAFTNLRKDEIRKMLTSQFYSELFIPGEKVFVVDKNNREIVDNSITLPYDYEKSKNKITLSMINPPAPYVSKIYIDDTVPKLNVGVGITLHNIGAIIAEFSFNRVSEFIHKQQIKDKGLILLTDSNGTILDHSGLKIIGGNLTDLGFKTGKAKLLIQNKIKTVRLRNNIDYIVTYDYNPDIDFGVYVFEEKNNIQAIIKENISFLIFIILMIIIEVLIISAYIYVFLIKPVNKLSQTIKSEGSNEITGNMGSLNYLKLQNEIGILYNGYDALIKTVNQKNRELVDLNKNLNILVLERTKELAEANNKLQHLDTLKNDFISNITHDFRSPLAGIVGFCEFIIRQKGNQESVEPYQVIYKSAKKLQYATDRLLDLAKLDSKGFLFKIRHIDIKTFIKDIIAQFYPLTVNTQIKILFLEPTEDVTDFYSDSDKLEQILVNLISNAIKYVDKENGVIKIELLDQEDSITIKVIDNGIGIDSEDMDRIFMKFERVDNEYNKNKKGSGIGLSFVKQLTEYLKGRIFVKSDGLGYGSTFTLILPKGKDIYQNYDVID